jgi:ABC-2 type transport system ATP-binding protein
VSVLGRDPHRAGRRWRERVGIVLQSGGLDAELTVAELVRLYGSFYAHPRAVEATIEQVGLAGKRKARIRTLSGGQLRRLDLALALVGDPELVFLDEPTTGFDPNARRDAWDLIGGLRTMGKTVLLTSHYLDEVQHLADRVGVLSRGRLIAESTPDTLAGRDTAEAVINFRHPDIDRGALPGGPWRTLECHGDRVTITTDDATRALLVLTTWATDRGDELPALTVSRPSLEDAYLELTDDSDDLAGTR